MPGSIIVNGSCNNARNLGAYNAAKLSYSTMYLLAGAKCVIGTRWEAYDAPTRLLMRKFWEAMQKGCCVSEALGIAKDWMRDESKFKDPVFWAQFAVFGDGTAKLWQP